MINISADVKKLRAIIPQAIITACIDDEKDYVKYECDLRHAKISPEENDSYFQPIKDAFGSRLMERYTHHTGLFDVYLRHETDPKLN